MEKRKKPLKLLFGHLKRYFRETTVHGFRYVIDGHGFAERAGWIVFMILSFVLAAVMIKANVDDVARNPISTSISTIPLQDVPFPAVTLAGSYLGGPGRLQESILNSFKFDCTHGNETCIQETSSIRSDMLPLINYTLKKYYENAMKKIKWTSFRKDYLSRTYLCYKLDPRKGYQSLAFAFARLYDNSNDTTIFEKSLLELLASLFRQPRDIVVDKLEDFIISMDENYVHRKSMQTDICLKWFSDANFTTEAVYFSSAIIFASGLFDRRSKIPLGTFLTRGEVTNLINLLPSNNKLKENNHPIWQLTHIYSKLLGKNNGTKLSVNSILEYLDYKTVNIKPPFLTGCKVLDSFMLFFDDTEKFCTTNITGPCCNFEIEISKEYAIVWKLMKYYIVPMNRYVVETSDKMDLSDITKNYDYKLDNGYMKNKKPIVLACKFGGSPLNPKCSLFRKMFTTVGIGYTFNNVPFYDMYLNTTENKAFFKEMYELEAEKEDNLPRKILTNGKGHSLEILLNHNNILRNRDGQKLMVHDPNAIADARNEALELEPGMLFEISVTPLMTMTDESALRLDQSKRKCLSTNERTLNIFRHYSQSGCLFECQLKRAIAHCNCSAWNYPRLHHNAKLCWFWIYRGCFEKQMELAVGPESCDCPDDCTSVHYGISVQSKPLDVDSICGKGRANNFYFSINDFLLQTNDLFTMNKLMVPPKTCQQRVKETVTFVRVFVASKSVSQIVRTTRVSFSSQLANLGGIIGLFTGMSILSLAEVVFWIIKFARAWMNAYMFPKRIEAKNLKVRRLSANV